MKLRLSLLSMLAVAASLFAFAGPASAVDYIEDQQACRNRTDFTAFFRNGGSADKWCYSNAGETPVWLGLTNVTYFNAGANSGWFTFQVGGTGEIKSLDFGKGTQDGCNNCLIRYVHLDK